VRRERKPNGYWTKETLLANARQYEGKLYSDWVNNEPKAYAKACTSKLLLEIKQSIDFKHKENYNGYWTKERCLESARKYETKMEWRRGDFKAYQASRNNGWTEECHAHMLDRQTDGSRSIYAMEFDDQSVYVGLTLNTGLREKQHMERTYNKALKENLAKGLSYSFVVLEEGLDKNESQERERATLDRYKQKGCRILNANGAGALGGTNHKWDRESCLAEARKHKTIKAWVKAAKSSVHVASKNGWWEECTAHMDKKRGAWTKEEALETAKQFDSITKWRKKFNGAYQAALKNGWLEECSAHMISATRPAGYWTLERCKESALRFDQQSKWKVDDNAAYLAANRKGWLEECCSHMKLGRKPNNYWTLERCKESSSKFTKVSDWKASESSAYSKARRNGWLEECCSHMKLGRKPKNYWTLKRCKESASKFTKVSDWKASESSAYSKAIKSGWLEEIRTVFNL